MALTAEEVRAKAYEQEASYYAGAGDSYHANIAAQKAAEYRSMMQQAQQPQTPQTPTVSAVPGAPSIPGVPQKPTATTGFGPSGASGFSSALNSFNSSLRSFAQRAEKLEQETSYATDRWTPEQSQIYLDEMLSLPQGINRLIFGYDDSPVAQLYGEAGKKALEQLRADSMYYDGKYTPQEWFSIWENASKAATEQATQEADLVNIDAVEANYNNWQRQEKALTQLKEWLAAEKAKSEVTPEAATAAMARAGIQGSPIYRNGVDISRVIGVPSATSTIPESNISIAEIEKRIEEQERALSEAKTAYTDSFGELNKVTHRSDFVDASERGATQNALDKSAEIAALDAKDKTFWTADDWRYYDSLRAEANWQYMSEEEKDIYNYLLDSNPQVAQIYLNSIESTVNTRAGIAKAAKIDAIDDPVARFAAQAEATLGGGIANFATGLQPIFTQEAAPTSAASVTAAQMREDNADNGIQIRTDNYKDLINRAAGLNKAITNQGNPEFLAEIGAFDMAEAKAELDTVRAEMQRLEANSEEYKLLQGVMADLVARYYNGETNLAYRIQQTGEKLKQIATEGLAYEPLKIFGATTAQILQDVGQAAAQMAPSMVVGAFNPLAGAAVMGASSGGNAYTEKINEGWTRADAKNYALLKGAAEGGLQYITGGISKLGGKYSISSAVSKLYDKVDNVLARVALTMGNKIVAEGGEEMLQAYIEPAIVTTVKNTDYEAPEFEEVLYNGLIGALMGVAGNVGEITTGGTRSTGASADTAGGVQTAPVMDEAPIQPQGEAATAAPDVVTDFVAAVDDILLQGRVNNTTANNIAANPELAQAFYEITGISLDNLTAAEARTTIQSASRERAYAAQQSESAARMAAAEAEAEQTAADLQAAQTQAQSDLQAAEAAAAQARSALKSAQEAAVRNSSYASYVRGLYLDGMTPAKAKEILRTPELKAEWEAMTLLSLPESTNKAVDLIVRTQLNDTTLPDPLAQSLSQSATESSGNIPATPTAPNASTDDSGELNSLSMQGGAGVSGASGKQDAPNTPFSENASRSGTMRWSDKADAKKMNAEDDIGQHVRLLEKTAENEPNITYGFPAPITEEEKAEAIKMNRSDLAGQTVMQEQAPTDEEVKKGTVERNFGSQSDRASNAAMSIRKTAANVERVAYTVYEKKAAETIKDLASRISRAVAGEIELSSVRNYYDSLKGRNDSDSSKGYYKEVDDKLRDAMVLLNREEPDFEKGHRAAADALELLDKRLKEAAESKAETGRLAAKMPDSVKKIKNSAVFKALSKKPNKSGKKDGKASLSIAHQLFKPENELKLLDGAAAHDKGDGYKHSESHRNSDMAEKAYVSEASAIFNELAESKEGQAVMRGETPSGVSIRTVDDKSLELSAAELIHFVRSYESVVAERGHDEDAISGILLKRDGETFHYDLFGKPKDVEGKHIENYEEFYERCKAAYDTLLASNKSAKLYDKCIADVYAYFEPKIKAAHKGRNGYELETLPNGKYFTIKWGSKDGISGRSTQKGSFFDNFGSVKSRTKETGGYLIVGNNSDVIYDYIAKAAKYSAWAEHAQTMKMLRDMPYDEETFLGVIERNLGPDFARSIEKYIDDLQMEGVDDSFFDETISSLRTNLAQAAITLKITTPVKQFAGTLAAGGDIDLSYLFAAQFGFGKKYDALGKNNPLYQHRALGNMDATVGNMNKIDDTWWKRAIGHLPFGKKWLSLIPKADQKAILAIYRAAAMQVSAEHDGADITKSESLIAEVDSLFNKALLDSQSNTTQISGASLYRDDRETAKNAVLFTSQQNAQFNHLLMAALEAEAAKGTDAYKAAAARSRRIVVAQAASSVEYALLGMLANTLLHKGDDWKDEEGQFSWERALANLGDSALETMAGIHIFGGVFYDALKAVSQVATGKEADTIYDPNMGGINSLLDFNEKTNRLLQNPNAKNFKDFGVSVSTLLGVPASGVFDILNAGYLWGRDVKRAIEGGNFDFFEYTDSVKAIENALAWRSANEEQKRIYESLGISGIYIPNGYKDAPSSLKGTDAEYELTRAERRDYQDKAQAIAQSVINELVETAVYKNATDKQKADMMKEAVSYGKDSAKKAFLEGKGEDYESSWDDERELEDLPEYLAFRTEFSDAYENKDYDSVDALIGDYRKLSDEAKDILDNGWGRLDDIAAAKSKNISVSRWMDFYDTWKDLTDKASSTENYGISDAAHDFAAKVDKSKLTESQASLIKEQMDFWASNRVNLNTYNKLKEEGMSVDSALYLRNKISDLPVLEGHSGVINAQKYEAIIFDETLTEDEKLKGLMVYATDAKQKKIKEGLAQKMSLEQIFYAYLD